MKKKQIIITLIILFFFSIIYLIFFHEINSSDNKEAATIYFQDKKMTTITVPFDEVKAGTKINYEFTVEKVKQEEVSYQLTLTTYHFIPFNIELYKIDSEDKEELIYICDESYTRNSDNEIVCTTEKKKLDSEEKYILKVSLNEIYNTVDYINLADFIEIEVASWQEE